MAKYKVFGNDSNFGKFEKVFDNKPRAYGFYAHMQENAGFIDIEEVKQKRTEGKHI